MHDVIIVGGGAMGSAAAWALTRAGREVLLLEKYGPGHDRGSSHGATRLYRVGYLEPDYIELARWAGRQWRELERESGTELLAVTGAVDHGLRRAELDDIAARWAASGVASEILSTAAARERWAGMDFDGDVLHQPDGGRLHADRAIAALQRLAAAAGAELRHGTAVTAIRTAGDAVEVVADEAVLRARHVVVAAGSWAPRLLADLIPLPALRVTQEQPAHFTPLDPTHAWPSFVQWRGSETSGAQDLDHAETYGLLTPGEGVKVGYHATGPMVDPDRTDRAPDPVADRHLREYVRRWFPGVDADSAVTTTCLYDNTASGDFVVDRVGPITVATGFSGHGFKFVPVIGHVIAGLVTGSAPAPPRFALAAHRVP